MYFYNILTRKKDPTIKMTIIHTCSIQLLIYKKIYIKYSQSHKDQKSFYDVEEEKLKHSRQQKCKQTSRERLNVHQCLQVWQVLFGILIYIV